jgi:hypothetical protein
MYHWVYLTREGHGALLCLETGARIRKDARGNANWETGMKNIDYQAFVLEVRFSAIVDALTTHQQLIQ